MKTNNLLLPNIRLVAVMGVMTCPARAGIFTFSNPAPIAVPVSGGSGPAAIYPSTIDVPGISGEVSAVSITLSGIAHSCTPDLDLLLVGPAGQNVLLMSDNGSCGFSVFNVNVTFDDTAAGFLPEAGSSAMVSGTFRPSDSEPPGDEGDEFPLPAPAGAFGTTLSVFNGINPAGTWRLFVNDDTAGDVGSISGGWSLSFQTIPEPGTAMLLGLGLSGLLTVSRRR